MTKDLTPKSILQWCAWTFIFLLFLALLSHAIAHLQLLPRSIPMGDADRVILAHQAQIAKSAPAYQGLILGDSSGLMNIDAVQLSQELQTPVLNLSLLSYVDFQAMGTLLQTYLQRHHPQWILLALHPEALRRPSPSQYHQNYLLTLLETTRPIPTTPYSLPDRLLGADHFRESLWETHCPIPLKGSFGRHYGFTQDFFRSLTLHQGSAQDPRRENIEQYQGSSEYWIADIWKEQAKQLVSKMQPSIKFYIVLSPIPESFAPKEYHDRYMEQWSEWNTIFSGPIEMSQAPATRQVSEFATHTHLTPEAQKDYTHLIANLLAPLLNP